MTNNPNRTLHTT